MKNWIKYFGIAGCMATLTVLLAACHGGYFASRHENIIKTPFANLDSSNYLCHVHKLSDENPQQTFNDYIATIKEAGFKTAVFCICSKCTNYDSDVWDSFWEGFDPDKGKDQPFFDGTPEYEIDNWLPRLKRYKDFHARGYDYPELATKLSRKNKISPWLSMRMNDVHNGREKGHFKHGSFVRSHPEFTRKTEKPGYFSHAMDYAHQEVRDHYLKLIRELLTRYDMDGLELDFMREPYVFSEGEEVAGARIMTRWLNDEVRPLVDAAEKRLGHRVMLSARVPSDPDTATAFGFDIRTWIDKEIFDVLIPTPRWATIEFDMPFKKWTKLRGEKKKPVILAGMEANYRPCVNSKPRGVRRELLLGAASAALADGADGIYTFNYFPVNKKLFLRTTSGCGSLENIVKQRRTHAVTYRDIVFPGEKVEKILPFLQKEGVINLRTAPVEKGSRLTLTLGILPEDDQLTLPEVKIAGQVLKMKPNQTRERKLVIAVGTWKAEEDLPAGKMPLNISWKNSKPQQIRRVELTVMPARIPPLKTAIPEDVDGKEYDLVVMGGTPGGIACAVRAAREGLNVLLVNHTQHIGGFITSGAGGWEAPYDGLRSPIYAEMLTGAARHYRQTYGEGSQQHLASMPDADSRAHIDRAKVEPRIAEMLFNRMVGKELSLDVLTGYIPADVERDGSLIESVFFKAMHGKGRAVAVKATVFADAMYEGDLMERAGVSNRIGRESRSTYNEPHAGVIYTMERRKKPGQRGFPMDADKEILNIRYNSHATAEIVDGPQSGEGDESVMAYNYRLILTRDPENRVLVEKPANYDPVTARKAAGTRAKLNIVPNLPNNKVAWNNSGRLIGPQNGYPGGDWEERERISQKYLDSMLMALWFAQNDSSAPKKTKKAYAGYGLAADEFPDNNNIPYEIYVREARRLVGRRVFTEHDNMIADGISRTPVHYDSVAMTDWPVDSVACLPCRVNGSHQDGIFFLAEICRPAQVPYRSLLPKEVDNLLVPVALSASHVGWGSIRLEPVWMQTGEAAGFAAALAVKQNTTPAELDPDLLIRTLVKNHFMVSFFNDVDVASDDSKIVAAQYFGTRGFFADYNARLNEPLAESVAKLWREGFEAIQRKQLNPHQLAAEIHIAEQQHALPHSNKDRGEVLLQYWQSLDEL
ncbi:MAG: FAD-dependent oxidoreductase [Kiritimatiellia bacterium]